jgi:Aldo/keto reductase family
LRLFGRSAGLAGAAERWKLSLGALRPRFSSRIRLTHMLDAKPLSSRLRCCPDARRAGQGLSRKEIFYELDQSLRRLGTDYVGLNPIHRWDYGTPIEETLVLHDVVKSGKVR